MSRPPTTGKKAETKGELFILRADPVARWETLISEWRNSRPERMEAALRRGGEIPPNGLAFLADLVAGKEKRRKGRPTKKESLADVMNQALTNAEYEKQLLVAQFKKKFKLNLRGQKPKEMAIEATANRRNSKPGTVDHIVFKRRRK